MEHLLTNITGLDMALCFALLLVYIRSGSMADLTNGLDTDPAD